MMGRNFEQGLCRGTDLEPGGQYTHSSGVVGFQELMVPRQDLVLCNPPHSTVSYG